MKINQTNNESRILIFSLLVSGMLFCSQLFAADLFDEDESKTPSLDERIKMLESDISVSTKKLNTQSTSNRAQQRQEQFKNSISGQLDASTLESEVQELKNEIIELNKELAILEQDILTPVSSQTALFLSLDKGNFFTLDGIKVEIDGKIVGHHLYTKNEIAALKKGAIQRVLTENLAPGDHEIVIILSGYSIDGRDVKQAANYKFYKPNSKKYIELAIVDDTEKQKAQFKFKEWQ